MIATLGLAGVFTAGLGAAGLSVQGVRAARRHDASPTSVRLAALVLLVGAVVAMGALELALLTDDFSLLYVARNHARATPPLFAVVTAWAALEGSIVLWGLVLAGYTFVMVRRVGHGDRLGFAAAAVLGLIVLFFFGMIASVTNPFQIVSPVPPDGPGPNPLLQNHILMAVHPPLLYLGLVGLSVPFAFAMGALALGRAGREWLERTRRATLVAWVFLTAGILVGALWSYEVLGWGGYWAWDPVENASLLPWLTATAFVHSAVGQSRRGVLKAWNVSLVIATFALTILATFLTRSGVVASVHSFTQSAIGPVLLGFLVVVLVASLGLFAARVHLIASAPRIDGLFSREGAFLVNNLLLAVLTFMVLVGTTYPIVLEALTGAQVSVGRPFFDRFAVPLSLALVVAMGVGPLLPYRAARPGRAWARLRVPLLVGLAAGAALVLAGVRVGWVVVVAVLSTTVVAAVVGDALRSAGDLPGPRRRALGRVVGRNRGHWGGQLAHVGVAVVAFAIALTGNLGTNATVTLETGDSAAVGPYRLRFDGVDVRDEPNRTVQAAQIAVLSGGREIALLQPRLNVYPAQAIGTPAVRTTATNDLYVALRRLEPDRVSLEVFRYPFMWLLWSGGGLIICGGLWALSQRRSGRAPATPSDTPVESETAQPQEVGARA